MMRKHCPDDETLMDFTEGRLTGRQRARVENHLASCSNCREQVAVCAELVHGPMPADTATVPEHLTREAIDQVTRPAAAGSRNRFMERTRRWVLRGMTVFERLVPPFEPEMVKVRGETLISEQLIRRTKHFKDLDVFIEIEKSGADRALIRIFPVEDRPIAEGGVRVALFKGEREVASMLLVNAPIVFEDIAFGVYTLVFALGVRGTKIGEYAFEVKERTENSR